MEPWIVSEAQRRREELLTQAAIARMLRVLESGRSRRLRGRLADGAQALSNLFAHVAQLVRDTSL